MVNAPAEAMPYETRVVAFQGIDEAMAWMRLVGCPGEVNVSFGKAIKYPIKQPYNSRDIEVLEVRRTIVESEIECGTVVARNRRGLISCHQGTDVSRSRERIRKSIDNRRLRCDLIRTQIIDNCAPTNSDRENQRQLVTVVRTA